MNNKIFISVVIIAIIIVGGLALAFSRPADNGANNNQAQNNYPAGQNSSPADNTAPNSSSADGQSVKNIQVSGNEFSFSPSEIKVKNGQPVKITFTNNGQFPHNWKVDEFNAVTPTAQTGQTTEVTFTPNQTGTFQYYCAVPGHKDRGMVGNLVVE